MIRAATTLTSLTILAVSALCFRTTPVSAQLMTPPGAAAFNITPTQVELTRPGASASVLIRNDSPETLRFRVTAFRWSNSADGEMVLAETNDVVFFPALFTVTAGQTRRLRVASNAVASERELAYRLILEQLPSEVEAPDKNGVRMLTRLNVPVFVIPPARTMTTTLDGLGVADGHVVFDLRNTGTLHVRIGDIVVQARTTNAELHDEQRLTGWYMLPGETRRYRVPVKPDVCRALASITVTAAFMQTVSMPRLEEHARVTSASCGAP
jgi:fimbrial chaperone protein